MTLLALLLGVLLCGVAHATWFPLMELDPEQQASIMKSYDIKSSYGTCKELATGQAARFIKVYNDKPSTIVLTGGGSGSFDIKFKDSLYIFDQSVDFAKTRCIVVPPYQPVEWISGGFSSDVNICSYEETTDPGTPLSRGKCNCDAVLEKSHCAIAKLPRTIRKPEHEFFLTADIIPQKDDVTICTILTVDRLLRLSQMSQFWGGPISAAIYLHDLKEIDNVMEWYLANNTMRRHVDIHLVYDDKIIAFELPDRPFPVNILRNVAVRFARTSNVFYIEGDFIPSPDLYSSLDEVKRRLAAGQKQVFIVAPFSTDNNEYDMGKFPKSKEELQRMIGKPDSRIIVFVNALSRPLTIKAIRDLSYFNSHTAFNFRNWFASTSIYPMGYAGGYEPYYIGPKSYPLFDEIFIGCGADKVSHPAELNAAGYQFHVLPTGFIVHIDSTGMGTPWCRGFPGGKRSSFKWEAFTVKINHIYSSKTGFESRIPWWDLAPLTEKLSTGAEDKLCLPPPPEPTCPPPPQCPQCETCVECQICEKCADCSTEPASSEQCKRFTEGYQSELAFLKGANMKNLDEVKNKYTKESNDLRKQLEQLQEENKGLEEYTEFVTKVSIGIILALIVVISLVVCVWPRGKRVWTLPAWKSTQHNL